MNTQNINDRNTTTTTGKDQKKVMAKNMNQKALLSSKNLESHVNGITSNKNVDVTRIQILLLLLFFRRKPRQEKEIQRTNDF